MVLAQCDYTIMHIFGERNCWGDLLSRWVNVPAVAVRAVAVFASSAPHETMPTKDAVREVQQQPRAGLSTTVSGASSFTTTVGHATKDNEDLVRVGPHGRDVLWISEQAKEMQTRLMVCVHVKDAGHQGVVVTLQRLQGYCCWFRMEVHVTEFVKQCLHCMDSKTGEKIPRPLGETVHGTRPVEVFHFDYLYVGDSGPLGKDELDEGDGFKYILVIMDDLSNFVWLEPMESCTAAPTAKYLLRWCKTLGAPEVWVSATASYFKNRVMKALEGALRVEHRFAVANSPWSNGTCERMMREMVRALKAILQEEGRDIREWVGVVPAVQWALNTAYREIYASIPYHVMFGLAPLTSFSTLASSTGEDWKVDALDERPYGRKWRCGGAATTAQGG